MPIRAQNFSKKRLHTTKNEMTRKECIEEIKQIAEKDCLYFDESGINRYLSRACARILRGIQVYGIASGMRYVRENLITAQRKAHIL